MASVRVQAATLVGLETHSVQVEVDVVSGLPAFTIVGLPDAAVKEAKERVISAIKNSRFHHPAQANLRVTVNLAPADLKKQGALFDLPIALGYLLASGQAKFSHQQRLFLGELSLSGRLRRIRGAVALAMFAKEQGIQELYLPSANAQEAALVNGLRVYGVESLRQLLDHLQGGLSLSPIAYQGEIAFKKLQDQPLPIDFSEVKGQSFAKRGLEIAAAGGHNMLMIGPPGSGKSLLAKALPGILPVLDLTEALDVSRIYSVAGLLSDRNPFLVRRPFRAPHHTASSAAILGGGSNPRPGEATLAHRGVLFLDEFPEFRRDVLEGLRIPLEEGVVRVARSLGSFSFPAQFMLIAAMNPCPCGYFNDAQRVCRCSAGELQRYRRKLSGPILDRIDLQVWVPRLASWELMGESDQSAESSLEVRRRVTAARKIQHQRFQGTDIRLNSEMSLAQVRRFCFLQGESRRLLARAVDRYRLSARGYQSILKVARTIADLEQTSEIKASHLSEALQYRKDYQALQL